MYEFRWNDWNSEHIAEHGITRSQAEFVVNRAKAPYPRYEGDGRYRVIGQSTDRQYVLVVFVFDPPGVIYVIHARRLTEREKRRYRRQKK